MRPLPPDVKGLSAKEAARRIKNATLEYAEYIGLEPDLDKDLLWLAQEGLMAALPDGWVLKSMKGLGDPVYYNKDLKKSMFEHPTDEKYRKMLKKLRKKEPQEMKIQRRLQTGQLTEEEQEKARKKEIRRKRLKLVQHWLQRIAAVSAFACIAYGVAYIGFYGWRMQAMLSRDAPIIHQLVAIIGSCEATVSVGSHLHALALDSKHDSVGNAPDDAENWVQKKGELLQLGMKWFLHAQDKGCTEGTRAVANSYYYGRGVEADASKAAELFSECAKKDDLTCAAFMGLLHYNGKGVEISPSKAIDWTVFAARRGDGYAAINLSVFLSEGRVVTRDYKEALKWAYIAQRNPQTEAMAVSYIEMMSKQNSPKEREHAKKLAEEFQFLPVSKE